MKKIILILTTIFVSFLFIGCHHIHKVPQKKKVVVIKKQPIHKKAIIVK